MVVQKIKKTILILGLCHFWQGAVAKNYIPVSGEVINYKEVFEKDQYINFAWILKAIDYNELADFGPEYILSPQNFTLKIAQKIEIDIPDNLTLPMQTENHNWFPITIEKDHYGIHIPEGTGRLNAIHGYIKIKRLVDFQNQSNVLSLINYASFQQRGSKSYTADISKENIFKIKLSQKIRYPFETQASAYNDKDFAHIGIALQRGKNHYYPASLAHMTSGKSGNLATALPGSKRESLAVLHALFPKELFILDPSKIAAQTQKEFLLATSPEKLNPIAPEKLNPWDIKPQYASLRPFPLSPSRNLLLENAPASFVYTTDTAKAPSFLSILDLPRLNKTTQTVFFTPPPLIPGVTPYGAFVRLYRGTSKPNNVVSKQVIWQSYVPTWIDSTVLPEGILPRGEFFRESGEYRVEIQYLGSQLCPEATCKLPENFELPNITHITKYGITF